MANASCSLSSKIWVDPNQPVDDQGEPMGAIIPGYWLVEATYSDLSGDRRGQQKLDLPETATDDDLQKAIIALY